MDMWSVGLIFVFTWMSLFLSGYLFSELIRTCPRMPSCVLLVRDTFAPLKR
uniref:Uncharacterized protein n=1 Tax=Anguilla anguilla TaxID=7936 RepID=A0A0E9WBS0_ANGAN